MVHLFFSRHWRGSLIRSWLVCKSNGSWAGLNGLSRQPGGWWWLFAEPHFQHATLGFFKRKGELHCVSSFKASAHITFPSILLPPQNCIAWGYGYAESWLMGRYTTHDERLALKELRILRERPINKWLWHSTGSVSTEAWKQRDRGPKREWLMLLALSWWQNLHKWGKFGVGSL